MQQFSTSPLALWSSLVQHKELILTMVKREVIGRYRGSALGLLWSFFNPLFMLTVYTFVFSMIFKARWNTGSDSKTEFALILFAGLIVFNLFSECINRAPSTITANVNYVKKVVFPLEILPWVTLGSVLFHATISLAVWIAAYTIFFGIPHLTVLLIPIIILPLIFFTIGISWALSSLGVYLRDVSQITGIATSVLMFLSPIFYPVSALPERIRPVLLLNPLAPSIEQVRQVLYFGELPNPIVWTGSLCIALFVAYIGFFWFQKTRKGFADVL